MNPRLLVARYRVRVYGCTGVRVVGVHLYTGSPVHQFTPTEGGSR